MNWKKHASMGSAFWIAAGAMAAPDGFTALFNGKDLEGWWGLKTEDPAKWMALPAEKLAAKKAASLEDVRAHWRVENGELINDGHGLFLTTERNYADFELRLEYQTVAGADSGVYLRGIPQVQIWDSTDPKKFKHGADKGSGGLWNNPKGSAGKEPLVLADKPFGEWNQLRVVMVGEYVTVHLNDALVVDHARLRNFFNRKKKVQLPIPREGPIQLQTHGGEIRWRNVFVREIDGAEANTLLAERHARGSAPERWAGAVDAYEIEDGEIRCRPKRNGTLYTAAEYADFHASFEFKVPPGGNNGLAIRYPGTGNPAYDGMCELQVLDDYAAKYAKLDPRQFHGSAYGMAAAHRGYLRPAGEWNFQTVRVVGSTIEVELNGTRILETDLAETKDYLKGKGHPGKSRERGHFGFAGHKDPVAFRNIRIEELHEK